MLLHSQGTSDLALRIGLNSGPTTAGVLRGEKARFQLFGDVSSKYSCYNKATCSKYSRNNRSLNFYLDINARLLQTVNTSARMESNGAGKKIHVSESTAELLKSEGKGYVLEMDLDL
jgi:class 3 adenylate cyclase